MLEEEKLVSDLPEKSETVNDGHSNFKLLVEGANPDYFQHAFNENGPKLISDYKQAIQELASYTHLPEYLKLRSTMKEDSILYNKNGVSASSIFYK